METAKRRATILDVGKRKKKDISQLKNGEGPLFEKVQSAVAQATVAPGKEVVPVVILFRKRSRRPKRGLAMLGPF
jgi:hypothetical protein